MIVHALLRCGRLGAKRARVAEAGIILDLAILDHHLH